MAEQFEHAAHFAAPKSVAVISLHTSPLSQPGTGDGGGLNIYVRELSAAMARSGIQVDIYVRRADPDAPRHVNIEPGVRLTHVDAGDPSLTKEQLRPVIDEFCENVAGHMLDRPAEAIHAHYWLSGIAGHQLKHALDIPLAMTFHTLARVKQLNGDPESGTRAEAEQSVIDCADVVFVSCEDEQEQLLQLYDIALERIKILSLGVDRNLFVPGDRRAARARLGLATAAPNAADPSAASAAPLVLFVGRLQPLKGADLAIEALALSRHENASLMIVGGPSGTEGERTLAHLRQLTVQLGLTERVIFADPQPHHLLPTYYQAANVCVVPSRSESFGLVALEAAACGIPVVASDVGGLRSTVADEVTGLLVADRSAAAFAEQIDRLLDDESRAAKMGFAATARAVSHTWEITAAEATQTLAALSARELVACA